MSRLLLHALALCLASSTYAAFIAYDDAGSSAYNGGWSEGSNGGSGFGAWDFDHTGSAGTFTHTSGANGQAPSGNIDTAGRSWGMYANGGQAIAIRSFTGGALGVGQQFVVSMDNGWVQNGGRVGFGLDGATGNRFEFYFSGGQNNYTIKDGNSTASTAVGFTDDGLSFTFSQLANNAFSLLVSAGGSSYTYNGSLTASDIDRVRFFNENAGANSPHDLYFNSMSVVPEPTNVALSIFGVILGTSWVVRRLQSRSKAVLPQV